MAWVTYTQESCAPIPSIMEAGGRKAEQMRISMAALRSEGIGT